MSFFSLSSFSSNIILTFPAVINHFSCRSLRIGSWRRIGQNAMDLVIFYSPEKSCMTYYINNDSAGYKIEYPFSYIKNIVLEPGDPVPNPTGNPPKPGGLVIELNRPPIFYMDSSNSGGFYQCGDFTEDQQATKCMIHYLGGHPKVLSVQLAKLVSLESFQNRMLHYDFNNNNAFASSAPVSPHVINRPASQPNHVARPQSGMYQDGNFAMGLQMGRGHKRQRSRSVPTPVDLSAMQQPPIPSFHIQHPSAQFQPDPSIFTPVRQARLPPSVVDEGLRVDTSSGYFSDFRTYPMSATTTASSEFANPSFLATSATSEQHQPTNLDTPYSLPFLSPSPMLEQNNMMNHSTTPLSQVSHADPIIANQSPPLGTMQHGSSADMFSMTADNNSAVPDQGLLLSEMYSKQNLNVPGQSPEMDDGNFAMALQGFQDHNLPASGGDFKQTHLPFDSVDPSGFAPEQWAINFQPFSYITLLYTLRYLAASLKYIQFLISFLTAFWARRWVSGQKKGEPISSALFLHYYQVHLGYRAKRPIRKIFFSTIHTTFMVLVCLAVHTDPVPCCDRFYGWGYLRSTTLLRDPRQVYI